MRILILTALMGCFFVPAFSHAGSIKLYFDVGHYPTGGEKVTAYTVNSLETHEGIVFGFGEDDRLRFDFAAIQDHGKYWLPSDQHEHGFAKLFDGYNWKIDETFQTWRWSVAYDVFLERTEKREQTLTLSLVSVSPNDRHDKDKWGSRSLRENNYHYSVWIHYDIKFNTPALDLWF